MKELRSEKSLQLPPPSLLQPRLPAPTSHENLPYLLYLNYLTFTLTSNNIRHRNGCQTTQWHRCWSPKRPCMCSLFPFVVHSRALPGQPLTIWTNRLARAENYPSRIISHISHQRTLEQAHRICSGDRKGGVWVGHLSYRFWGTGAGSLLN